MRIIFYMLSVAIYLFITYLINQFIYDGYFNQRWVNLGHWIDVTDVRI